MSTKEWLSRAWKIDNEITALERELLSAKERMLSVTAHYSDIKVQTSKGNKTEYATLKYIEYKNKLECRIDALYAVKCEIADAISKVDNPTYRTLLELRYLRYMTWEKIAVELDITFQWVHVLHKRALKKIKTVDCN